MPVLELQLSGQAFRHLAVILPFALVAFGSAWLLLPRLAPAARWLALAALAIALAFAIVAMQAPIVSGFERWLWDLADERNLPAALSSLHLALVSLVALLLAWRMRGHPGWRRMHWLLLCLLFCLLGLEDWAEVLKSVGGLPGMSWKGTYRLLGGISATLTLLVMLRSPRSSWRWYLCVLCGLAVMGFGGLLIDRTVFRCHDIAFIKLDGCADLNFADETLEFLGAWLALIGLLGFGCGMQASWRGPGRLAAGLLLGIGIPLLSAVGFLPAEIRRHALHIELAHFTQPASVAFESKLRLAAFQLEPAMNKRTLLLYTATASRDLLGGHHGFSARLVDQANGESAFSLDARIDDGNSVWLYDHDDAAHFRHWLGLDIPPEAPRNRAYWIVLSFWRETADEFQLQRALSSDRRLLSDRQIVLGELVIPAEKAESSAPVLARFGESFVLTGVDMPASAARSQSLPIAFSWRADAAGKGDFIQFLHLFHEESGAWHVYDQQPLGARLPTRVWYAGLSDSQTWQLPLPADMPPGQYQVFTGLYRHSDQQRLPAAQPDGSPWPDDRLPVGVLEVK